MGEDSPASRQPPPPPTTTVMTTSHVSQQSMTSLRGSVERLDVNANDSVIRCDETYPGQEAWSKKDLKAAKRYGKIDTAVTSGVKCEVAMDFVTSVRILVL